MLPTVCDVQRWSMSSCGSVGFRNSLPAPRRRGLGTFSMRHLEQGGRDHSSVVERFIDLVYLHNIFYSHLVLWHQVFKAMLVVLLGLFHLKGKRSFFWFFLPKLNFLWKIPVSTGSLFVSRKGSVLKIRHLPDRWAVRGLSWQVSHTQSVCLTWAGPRQFSHSWCIHCHWALEALTLQPLCGRGADLSWSLSIKNVCDLKLIAQCADCSLPPPNVIVKGSAFIICSQLLYMPVFSFE